MKEWAEPISPASLVEQVNAEGAEHGLCGFYEERAQTVFVCEREPQTEGGWGIADCSRMGRGRILASVDDEHPLSAVFGNRVMPGEVKPGDRYKRFEEAQAAQARDVSEQTAREIKDNMARRLRGGAIFYGGQLADTEMNRKARRIRQSLRRRNGR